MITYPKNRSCEVYSVSGNGHGLTGNTPAQVRKAAALHLLKRSQTKSELKTMHFHVNQRIVEQTVTVKHLKLRKSSFA